MKRIIPADIYQGLPCSVVATGCAMGVSSLSALSALVSDDLHNDGYLSLDGMNKLIRSNQKVKRCDYFKRGNRPSLLEWASMHEGERAVICLIGHFIYFDGENHHSFFENDYDPVVKVWYLE